MSCIYYIGYGQGTNPKDGYIGKDSSNNFQRIYDHVYEAYTGGHLYGSEHLIRQYGASGVRYTAFTAAEHYGIRHLKKIKYQMTNKDNPFGYGTFENDKDLELAELLHIVYARVSGTGLSLRNINIGGDSSLNMVFHPKINGREIQNANERFTTIEVSQGNRAELYQKIIFPVQYRIIEETVRNKITELGQDSSFQATLIQSCLQSEQSAKDQIQQQVSLILNNKLLDAFEELGYNRDDLQKGKIQFDVKNVVEAIYSMFQYRWNKATPRTIRINKNNYTTEEALVTALQQVVFNYMSGGRQGKKSTRINQPVDIQIPVAAIQSITVQPKRFPKGFRTLKKDLDNLILKRAQDKNDPANGAKNAAGRASAKFFIQVYTDLEDARKNAYAELHQVATADTIPVITTLSQKMKQAYSEKGLLSASSVLFQHGILFYDDMMQYLRDINKLPELIYLTAEKDKLTRKGEGYYVYQGKYLAGIEQGGERARGGRNTRNNLRHGNYF